MTSIHPYLTFNGDCEAAFTLYKGIFGGDFQTLSRFGEMPPDPEYPVSEEDRDLIMHVSLPIGDHSVLMGSDTSENFGHKAVAGSNFSISINVEKRDKADEIFKKLSDKGYVIMPMADTFWESYFGMCKDRFGIQWMVSAEHSKSK
ncbi:VOC family protein [Constantimarinum furrinae]|uniref:Glyoxalase n=1 Tax=Constantimarinum furrinae TaxID=2562285 RepID=A0A7G8PUS1_9FLAO|nr:VOC family protein [Constantimarinum furrinae]QNJ98087.1 glyoxalase [Constantimarinum furrinae]